MVLQLPRQFVLARRRIDFRQDRKRSIVGPSRTVQQRLRVVDGNSRRALIGGVKETRVGVLSPHFLCDFELAAEYVAATNAARAPSDVRRGSGPG